MASDGTTFDIDLSGIKGAASVTAAADGVSRLSVALDASQVAAAAAAAAMGAGEAAYKAAESAANKAALSVEKIGLAVTAQEGKAASVAAEYGIFSSQFQRASDKLGILNARQAEAAAKAVSTSAAMNAEALALDKLKASAAGAASSQAGLGKALDNAKTAAAAAQKVQTAAAGSGKVNELAEGFGKLGGPLGAVGQKLFGTAEGFKKLSGSLGSAGPYVAVAVGIVAIATAVIAVSAAVAVGIGGITLWAIKLADTDGVLKKLLDRGTAGFKKIFSGLNIKPLLGELSKVADLFDEGSASANAIKTVFNSLFQPIVDGITAVVPMVVAGFIQFEIMALKALIAIKPFGSTILTVAKVLGVIALIITGVVVVAIGVLAAGVAAMAVGFGVLIAIVGAVILALGWIVMKVVEVGAAIVGGFGPALEWLKGLSLTGIGTAMIDGLIAGITGAAGGVLKAMTGAVGGAIDGAKSLLGIASPSKVFAEIGTQTGAGMVEGVEGSAGDVQGSLESMVAPPDAASGGAGGATGAAKAGGGTSLAGATFNFYGVKGAEDALDMLRSALETIGAQAGTAVPSAG